MTNYPTQQVLGIPIAAVTMDSAMDIVHEAITSEEALHIGVVNGAKVVNMRRDPALRDAVLQSDVIFADGMSVVWASRILGVPLPERVTGIGLMMNILARGSEHGYRVYLLGAKEEVVGKVADNIARDYPGVKVVGYRNGYFSGEDEAAIAEDIAASRPDVLFVAITSPKKETFLARWSSKIGAKIYHGVGGSFDVYAGKVKRAPAFYQRYGLEWLYRVMQEPRRMWKRYLDTNTRFIWLVSRTWMGNLFQNRKG